MGCCVLTVLECILCGLCVCVMNMRGGFLCDMEHGVEKAMIMRGGVCAAEHHLMGVRVCCVVYRVCFGFLVV